MHNLFPPFNPPTKCIDYKYTYMPSTLWTSFAFQIDWVFTSLFLLFLRLLLCAPHHPFFSNFGFLYAATTFPCADVELVKAETYLLFKILYSRKYVNKQEGN